MEIVRTFGITIILGTLLWGAPLSRPEGGTQDHARLRAIVLTYVGAYETSRRFEEFSREHRGSTSNVLVDEKYYRLTFESTALDARETMVTEEIEGAELPGTWFFKAYSSTVSPPHPVYVVGIRANGVIFRLQGFGMSDFDAMVEGYDAKSKPALTHLVRLYYMVSTPFEPGPILDDDDLTRASEAFLTENRQHRRPDKQALPLFLPESVPEDGSTLLRICVYDAVSTRLEIHRLRVSQRGPISILETAVVRDIYKSVY
jgi:hypothetical protein